MFIFVLLQLPKYLVHVEGRLKEENNRSQTVLDARTRKPLMECLERQLITTHVSAMLERGK